MKLKIYQVIYYFSLYQASRSKEDVHFYYSTLQYECFDLTAIYVELLYNSSFYPFECIVFHR